MSERGELTIDTLRTPALRLDHVAKAFGTTTAVDDVELTVDDGELVALVGPSGCGKSTLLRLIAGLIGVDRGRIDIAGQTVDDGAARVDPERRQIGLVFQEHALFPHLTVAQNIAFGLRGLRRDERQQRRDHWVDLVGLGRHAGRYPHELSGGERQRVALARALAPAPRLMLLDEPFASLDPNLRTQMRAEVVGLLRSTDTPAVFVTHDQTEALATGDRVAVMRDGRIVQLGTPTTVYHAPHDRFVAAFMGEADFLPIRRVGERVMTELGELAMDVDSAPSAVAVVRPEDVSIAPAPGGPGEVVDAEFQGASWLFTVRLDSGTVLRARTADGVATVGTRVRPALRPGHRVVLVAEET
jgi:iron(III) transport system ATP-binding protein